MAVYLDAKTKKYFCKFHYKDWSGRSRQTVKRGFTSKREAKLYEENFRLSASGKPTMTVQELADEMMTSAEKRLKPNSIRQKKMLYRLYICNSLGSMKVANITPQTIRKWQDELPNKSPSTIAAINTAFSALLNYAVKFHNLEKNPFTIAGKTGKPGKRLDFWEPSQFEIFISNVDNPMYHAIYNLFFYSGLRRGELLALTEDDVDFRNNTITVNKSMGDEKIVLPPKTPASIRTISLPSWLMAEIKAWRDTVPDPPQQFFLTSYALLKNYFNKYQKDLDLPHLSLHGLRHSHASYLIQKGVPITSIAKRLGHSPNVTLKIYSHFYADGDKKIANLLEK